MKFLIKLAKKFFLPHKENNHKPHFFRHESFLFLALLVIILELSFLTQVFFVFDKTKFLAAVLPGALESLANENREEASLSPLVTNPLLQKAAQLKAEDMAKNSYFAHTSPDGKTPWYWLSQVGYQYSSAGENLAVNFFESEDVSKAWMNSPSHRANIMKPGYTEIGVGVASGTFEGRESVFVAQFFGTPTNSQTPRVLSASAEETNSPVPKPTQAPSETRELTMDILGQENSSLKTEQKIVENVSRQTVERSSIFGTIAKILTSPRNTTNSIYITLSIVIALALILFFVKSEIKHPSVILRGFGMLAIIISLSLININIPNLEPQITTSDLGANFIDSIPQ